MFYYNLMFSMEMLIPNCTMKRLFSKLNSFEVNICTCMLKVSFRQKLADKSLDWFVVTIDYNQIPLIVLIYYVSGEGHTFCYSKSTNLWIFEINAFSA